MIRVILNAFDCMLGKVRVTECLPFSRRSIKIGSGGFGAVYKGEDVGANVTVAIKTIHADKMDEAESRNFEKEIKVQYYILISTIEQ